MPDMWSEMSACVLKIATFFAWPGVFNDPCSVGAAGFDTSRIPSPKKSAATYAVEPTTRKPQILSGKVYVPRGFGAAGFEMSTTVNVWSAAM